MPSPSCFRIVDPFGRAKPRIDAPSAGARVRGFMTALAASLASSLLSVGMAHAEATASAQRVSADAGRVAARAPAPDLPVDRLMAGVVRIEASAAEDAVSAASLGRNRFGSGVVIDERTVLTIGYLVLETDRVDIVTPQGRRIPAAVSAYDHQTGFGLVRALIPLGITPIELGDSDTVSERSRVLTLGQGEREITELMVVSRKPFSGSWEYLLERPFYTFPPVNNWSGAALFGRDGKLIGIGSMVVQDAASDRGGVPGNLYVPVNLLKPVLSDLQAKGRRSEGAQPWLGINTESVYGNLMITRVQPGSPADRAGLQRGAVIMTVGGQAVSDLEALYRTIRTAGPAGASLAFKVLQQGAVRDLEIRSIDRADFIARRERGRGI
jgi:S1-C subfamily serine protease